MATLALSPPPRARSWRGSRTGDAAFQLILAIACMFAFRDTLTGALRFVLAKAGLSVLWFLPDALSLFAFGWFAWTVAYRQRSPWAVLLVINAVVATIIGWMFMAAPLFALVSSIKLFLPFFVGCCFAGRSLTEIAWVRWTLGVLMVVSIVGLLLSPYVDFPWLANSIDNFGYAKSTGRVWWAGTDLRYGGFAGESTMAAYMCVFPYFLLYRHLPRWAAVALLVPIWFAVDLSTSKTSEIVFVAFVVYYVVTEFLVPMTRRLDLTRKIAFTSFALVPTPFLLMAALSGTDLSSVSAGLFSLQDRINNTWRFPFAYMSQHFPIGLITGCGLGCFTYPMQYTDLAVLWVPVDSFFVATYVMLGLPFVLLAFGMVSASQKSQHIDKLLLMALTNLYVITVQGYGPSTTTIFIAYAISDMFLPRVQQWRRSRVATPMPAG